MVETWKIAPGYEINFSFARRSLEFAWIERTLPEHPDLRPEPKDDGDWKCRMLAMERYALINPAWTPKGLQYREITSAYESKSVQVPFSDLNAEEIEPDRG